MPVGMMFGMLEDSPGGCLIAPNQHWICSLFMLCNRQSGRYPWLGYAGTTATGRVHHDCICFVLGRLCIMEFSVCCSCVSSSSCSEMDWLVSLPVQSCAPHLWHRGTERKTSTKWFPLVCPHVNLQECRTIMPLKPPLGMTVLHAYKYTCGLYRGANEEKPVFSKSLMFNPPLCAAVIDS